VFYFFFQAEYGIRSRDVTGVQTFALPIYRNAIKRSDDVAELYEICREVSIDRLEARARERAEKDSDRLMELLLKALRPEKNRERNEVTNRKVTDFIIDITPNNPNAGIDANQSDKPTIPILE